ncbi:MAG: SDR family oxidoreductase [Micromonosporaceae bacterium]|nr:SDR family oxidoreductase [Micromonosporaceae bacterium]
MSRTVVITGASAGIGRAIAQEYARRGERIALLARGQAGLAAAERECRELGAEQAMALQCDVADGAAVDLAAEHVAAELGPVDVWVNNAMVSVFAPAWEITADEYRRVIEVNYLGAVHGTLAALRQMRPRGHGCIVEVGSALAFRGIPLQAPYCASKHAIEGFVESLRAELLRDCPDIKVTMVQLPAVNTPQFSWVRTRLPRHPQPVPPIYQPEVAARAVVWASDHRPRELNVGAPTIKTRVANALAPGLLDHYLARKGFDSQQTGEHVNLARWHDNIDRPMDAERDFGAHGVFDHRAQRRSLELWAATHKRTVAAAAALTAAAAAGAPAVRNLLGRRNHR